MNQLLSSYGGYCLIGSKRVAEGQKVKAIYLDFQDKSLKEQQHYGQSHSYIYDKSKLIIASIDKKTRYFKIDDQYLQTSYTELTEIQFFNDYSRRNGDRVRLDTLIDKYFVFSQIKVKPEKKQ